MFEAALGAACEFEIWRGQSGALFERRGQFVRPKLDKFYMVIARSFRKWLWRATAPRPN